MDRSHLVEGVRSLLAQAGFAVSERCDLRPVSFDLVARRDKDLILLKILGNVDAASEAIAAEMKLLGRFLHAKPLIIGLRSGTGELETGVVYGRYSIPILHPATLQDHLRGDRPMVFAAPGGFYVHVDGRALQQARLRAGMSLGVLAQVAGVSRRAIQMYEQGMNASIDAAMRLEEFLGAELILPIDPLEMADLATEPDPPAQGPADPFEELVKRVLEGMGYNVRPTRRSPFNALSTDAGDTLITGYGEDSPQLRRRAAVAADVSRIAERPGLFIVERTTRTHIQGMPVVTRHELRRLSDPEKVLDLILERQGSG